MNPEALKRIAAIVGLENLSATTAERYAYSTDAGIHRALPDAIARPKNAQEISAIVKLANELRFPVIPRGAGTALCGHSVAVRVALSSTFRE